MAGSEMLKRGGTKAVGEMVFEIGLRRLLSETYAQIAAALRVTRGVVAGLIYRHLRVTDRDATPVTPGPVITDEQDETPQAVYIDADQMTRNLVAPGIRSRIIDLGREGLSVEEIGDQMWRVPISIIARVLRSEGIEPAYSTYVCQVLAALNPRFE